MDTRAPTAQIDAQLLADVAAIVAAARTLPHAELEVRFGLMHEVRRRGASGRRALTFKPSISRKKMDDTLRYVETNALLRSLDWSEHMDVFFELSPGRTARTRVEYDVHDLVTSASTCVKRKVEEVIVRTGCFDEGADLELALRVVLSTETPVDASAVPVLAPSTQCVRLQQRRRFLHSSGRAPARDDAQGASWAFDFNLTWQATTKSEAEEMQQSQEPRFEMEIELLDRQYMLAHDDQYVAHSLLLKALDFLAPSAQLRLHSSDELGC